MAKSMRNPGRLAPSLLKQTGVSVAATLIATGLLAGLRAERSAWRPETTRPSLTSGGKFAARVDALTDPSGASAPLALPMFDVPVLAAALLPLPAAIVDPVAARAASLPGPDLPARPVRHLASRAEPRHRVAATPAPDVMPSPRSDRPVTLALAPAPVSADAEVAAVDVWSTTKSLTHDALWLGEAMIDAVNPMRLLP